MTHLHEILLFVLILVSSMMMIHSPFVYGIVHSIDPDSVIVSSPLKQLESGTNADQVKCNQGFQLIFKQENMSPICVKPDTSKILIERGWATPIPGISFGGPTNIINDTQLTPKVTLYDYFYDGIDKDNTTVSINNQTYYQVTLDYADFDLKKGTSIQFQNVTFAFPQGVMTTPGGAFIMLDMKFQDGPQETYGENKINPDGSGAIGGIQIPTQYGPSSAKNSITVLSNHLNPQAGLTIYHDKIKLLVSTNQISTVNNGTVNRIAQVVLPCVSKIPHQYSIAGPRGDSLCPVMNFGASEKILNATGFYGIYNYASYPGTLNYVLDPGHNGTIKFLISVNMIHNFGNITYSNQINITNDAVFMHDAGMNNHPGVDVLVEPKSEVIGDNGSALVTMTFSASKDALPGTYWVTLPPGFCAGGQMIILTVTVCEK